MSLEPPGLAAREYGRAPLKPVCSHFQNFSSGSAFWLPIQVQVLSPTVVLVDRASVHTCSAVNQQRKRWQDLGLIIAHLPAYSPELNDMEPQWRHLKYQELPERHYQNKTDLRRAVGGANWGIAI
ncbi:transposase [Deinococcus sp. SL84]|uniref:transposase n=1 Tax=Deinococcus sp. SL84 TaxID=2994663 RepID=UPI003FA38B4F